jgi:predicted enzyme related to lactoylglutathione lyase
MTEHLKLSYVEFPAKNLPATKAFFKTVFQWSFKDYGPEYSSFSNAGLEGGFYKSDLASSTETGAALIVFYSKTLEATQREIEKAGGEIVKRTFSFPGGRRFHFVEPSGNEFAVWSDIGV